MASGTRVAVILAAFVTTVPLAACSGSGADGEGASTESASTGGPASEDSGTAMRLTLTDDGCTYEGETTLATGTFTVEAENQTQYFGAFALAALTEGSTMDDLEPWLEEARQQFQDSGALPDLPPFYDQVVRSGVEAGASGFLPADVPAGRYALMCFVDDLPTWLVYPAAQFDVTG